MESPSRYMDTRKLIWFFFIISVNERKAQLELAQQSRVLLINNIPAKQKDVQDIAINRLRISIWRCMLLRRLTKQLQTHICQKAQQAGSLLLAQHN